MGKKSRLKRERLSSPDVDVELTLDDLSEAELQNRHTVISKAWLDSYDRLPGRSYEEAHLIAFNLMESVEAMMRKLGIRIPEYRRRLGGQTRADAGNFTYCYKCDCAEIHKKKKVWVCPYTFVGPTKATAMMFEPSEEDGCTRGIPKKEYRK